MGQPEEGIEWILKAMRLNPYHPERFWGHLGRAYFVALRYGEAIEAFRHINQSDAGINASFAAAYANLGDGEHAEQYKQNVMQQSSDFSIKSHLKTLHYRDEADRDHHRQALIKAGFPA